METAATDQNNCIDFQQSSPSDSGIYVSIYLVQLHGAYYVRLIDWTGHLYTIILTINTDIR